MDNKLIRHIVGDMDETMIQRCIICGEIISDYRGAIWPNGQQPPTGFNAGEVYVRNGNPRVSITILAQEATFINCK